MDYETVIKAIIRQEKDYIGDLAVKQAEQLDFVTAKNGDLSFTRPPTEEDVEQVLAVFEEFQGRGATGIARRAMEDLLEPDDMIDVPERILPQTIKEERFASSI